MRDRIKAISIIVILVLIFDIVVSGCGRTPSKTANEPSSFNSEDYILIDGPEEESADSDAVDTAFNDSDNLELITQKVIWNKKLKQFERANANTEIMGEDDIKNILLIGQDRRSGDKAEMRSDSMIIFSINTVTNEVNLISLMRDMYIPCADGKEGMINLTYLNGQAPLLEKTIEMNFGIHIDNYAEVDFWRFMDLFEMLGPLDVELTEKEASFINDMSKNHRVAYYDYGEKSPIWTLYGGVNSLDPEQLLSFCRVRQDIGGDWGRTERQRRAIKATYNKLMNMSTAGLIRMVRNGHKFFTTDMTIEDMLGYLYVLKKNRITEINGYLIPVEGTYKQEMREETLHVLIPNIEQNKQAIQQYINGNDS